MHLGSMQSPYRSRLQRLKRVPSCALTFLAPEHLFPLISLSPAPFASLLSQAPQPQGSELGGLVSVLPLGLTQSFSLDLSAKLKA